MRNKLFNYFGAKTRFVDQIFRNLHPNFRKMKYCSVFGGSGVDLYYKPRSKVEIYNNIDKGLSSIFWCLINEYNKFIERLDYCIQSEQIFNWFKDYEPLNRIDEAIKTLYLCHYSIMGQRENFWRQIKYESTKNKYRKLFEAELFINWKNRFNNIQIFNEDFRKFIERVDEEQNLFYLDPPYIKSTERKDSRGKYYSHNFSMNDHQDLFELLSNCKSKWLLSYDNNDWVLNSYSNYNIIEIEVHYTSSSINKQSKNIELLISNYPFPKHNPLLQKRTISLSEFI